MPRNRGAFRRFRAWRSTAWSTRGRKAAACTVVCVFASAVVLAADPGLSRLRATTVSPVRAELTDSSLATGQSWSAFVTYGWHDQVTAQFAVPALSCQPGEDGPGTEFWVGIQGPDSNGNLVIVQTGFTIRCSQGQPNWFAWAVNDPSYPTSIPIPAADSVTAGDSLTATAYALDGQGDYGYQLDDYAVSPDSGTPTLKWSYTYPNQISGGPDQSYSAPPSFLNLAVASVAAAVAAESTAGGAYFDPVQVTDADVDGDPLGQFNPAAWEEDPSYYGGTAALDPVPQSLGPTGQSFAFAWNSGAVGPNSG